MNLYEAKKQDFPFIKQLLMESFTQTYLLKKPGFATMTANRVKELSSIENFYGRNKTFVLKDGDIIIGTVTLQKGIEIELKYLAVDPTYQGQGFGKVLVEHCLRTNNFSKTFVLIRDCSDPLKTRTVD